MSFESVGRFSRSRIDRDRYEPNSNPPVYKVSLYYDLESAPSYQALGLPPPPPPAPAIGMSSSRQNSPSKLSMLSRSQVLARDLRPDYSPRIASPKIAPTYSPGMTSDYHVRESPRTPPRTSTLYRASPQAPKEQPMPSLATSQLGSSSPSPSAPKMVPIAVAKPGPSREKQPLQSPAVDSSSPVKKKKTPAASTASPSHKPLPSASRHATALIGSTVDDLIRQALVLQEQGKYEDAHEILLQVERMRLGGADIKPAQVPKAAPVVYPRRASVVLEQVRMEQQHQVAAAEDEFDSLQSSSSDSEEDDDAELEPEVMLNEDEESRHELDGPSVLFSPFQTTGQQEQNTSILHEEEPPSQLGPEVVSKAPAPASAQHQAHQVSTTDLERERIKLNRVRRKSQTEELLEQVFGAERQQQHAVAFSDQPQPQQQQQSQPFPDMETVTVDKDEAQETLRGLKRELTTSRLPELSFKAESNNHRSEEHAAPQLGYASKEGFLLKLSENPTGIIAKFRSQKSLTHSRYFRLTGGVLMHSKTKESKVPRGMISLDGATVEFVRCEGIQFGYCVAIKASARNYTLFPETKQDAVEWVVALENNIKVFAREKEEEAARNKLLARRRQTDESYRLNSSFSMITTDLIQNLVGQDVTSGEFRDLTGESDETHGLIGGLYDVLGATPSSSLSSIKKTYYRLAKLYHPDKQSEDPSFAAKFAQINHAFHILSDDESRARYDLGERVKFALRRGVQVVVVEKDGSRWQAALYIGPSFKFLYYQQVEYGPILQDGFQFCELRFVQEIRAQEDCTDWPSSNQKPPGQRLGLRLSGQRLGKPVVFIELDTEESRNEILDGLRILRCDQSVLFAQTLTNWLNFEAAEGGGGNGRRNR